MLKFFPKSLSKLKLDNGPVLTPYHALRMAHLSKDWWILYVNCLIITEKALGKAILRDQDTPLVDMIGRWVSYPVRRKPDYGTFRFLSQILQLMEKWFRSNHPSFFRDLLHYSVLMDSVDWLQPTESLPYSSVSDPPVDFLFCRWAEDPLLVYMPTDPDHSLWLFSPAVQVPERVSTVRPIFLCYKFPNSQYFIIRAYDRLLQPSDESWRSINFLAANLTSSKKSSVKIKRFSFFSKQVLGDDVYDQWFDHLRLSLSSFPFELAFIRFQHLIGDSPNADVFPRDDSPPDHHQN